MDIEIGDKVIITEGGAEGTVGVAYESYCHGREWGIKFVWPGCEEDGEDVFVYERSEFRKI